MRNLLQYPITDNDRVAVLESLLAEVVAKPVSDRPIGGMTEAVLTDLIKGYRDGNL